jgi:hypothetical protein
MAYTHSAIPLVLEFIIGVFHIGPLPVKLQQCQEVFFQVGHQHHLFVERAGLNLHAPLFQQRKDTRGSPHAQSVGETRRPGACGSNR